MYFLVPVTNQVSLLYLHSNLSLISLREIAPIVPYLRLLLTLEFQNSHFRFEVDRFENDVQEKPILHF